jgi:hypothetical protein
MPQIPRYNRQVINEKPLDLQENLDFTADKAVGQLGQTISSVGDMYGKFKEEADRTRAKEVANAYTQMAQNDLNTNFLNTQNRNAIGISQKAQDTFKKYQMDLTKDLSPNQRRYAEELISTQNNTFYNNLSKHETSQIGKYEDEVFQSTVENYREQAAFNATDFNVVNDYLAKQEEEIFNYTKKKGLYDENDPTVAKKYLMQETSKTRRMVLDKLVDTQNVESAEEFLKANEDKMTEADVSAARKAIESGVLAVKGQQEADRLFPMGMQAGLREANKIENVKLRDEVKKRLMGKEREFAEAERLDGENQFEAAISRVRDNPRTFPRDLLGAAKFDRLPFNRQEALIKLYESGGQPTKTNPNVYYNLRLKAGNRATREDFKNMDLRLHINDLALGEFKEMVKLQQDLRKGINLEELDGIQSKNDIIKQAFEIKYSLKNKNNMEKFATFWKKVDTDIVAWKRENKKDNISNEELRKITNRLMTEVVTSEGYIYDAKKPVFLAGQKIGDVPKSELNIIRQMLTREGLRPTESAILERYNERLRAKMENQ